MTIMACHVDRRYGWSTLPQLFFSAKYLGRKKGVRQVFRGIVDQDINVPERSFSLFEQSLNVIRFAKISFPGCRLTTGFSSRFEYFICCFSLLPEIEQQARVLWFGSMQIFVCQFGILTEVMDKHAGTMGNESSSDGCPYTEGIIPAGDQSYLILQTRIDHFIFS